MQQALYPHPPPKSCKYTAQQRLGKKILYILFTLHYTDSILQDVTDDILTFFLLFGVLQYYIDELAQVYLLL